MSANTLFLNQRLYEYMLAVSVRENDILKQLRQETLHYPMHAMQISPEQGQFMSLLIKLTGASRAVEIGVFTGYSSLCVAMALPENGKLIACDVNEEWTSVAKKYWEMSGVGSKVNLFLAPAVKTLGMLIAGGESDTFDFVFIDADKENYDTYYEYSLKLLRKGGLMAIDNVFWHGSVADVSVVNDQGTRSVHTLNKKIYRDERVDVSMLPIGDGLTLIMKR